MISTAVIVNIPATNVTPTYRFSTIDNQPTYRSTTD